jgi:hypothetical protein
MRNEVRRNMAFSILMHILRTRKDETWGIGRNKDQRKTRDCKTYEGNLLISNEWNSFETQNEIFLYNRRNVWALENELIETLPKKTVC